MTVKKGLYLLLALCLLLSIGTASASASEAFEGNWALVAAETAEGTPYTSEQIAAVFRSSNFMISLYPGGTACLFAGGMLADQPMEYTHEGGVVEISGIPGAPFVLDPDNSYYAYMQANDGSIYTFSRQTAIEGMWVLTAMYDSEGNRVPDETIIEAIGGYNYILVFNYNCSISSYLDGVALDDALGFQVDADESVVMFNPDSPDEAMDIVWLNEEQFQVNNGNITMEYTIVYPIQGEWGLSYALQEDGSFLSKEQVAEVFGSDNVSIFMHADSTGYIAIDGEAATTSESVRMNAGTVMLGDLALEFDESGNMLGTEAEGLWMVFTRSTPIIIPGT